MRHVLHRCAIYTAAAIAVALFVGGLAGACWLGGKFLQAESAWRSTERE